ncbi:oligopeptide ABC transport system substrate binding protein AppA [Gottschalkia acidurici 9a]|uniref:Oligopeptide ABC transport system substrate binding protein AppA n=1 Tax=Gottschalkia acidurici (strain ATCC 7906 / DSM 604 / BCRC 14475 / CIP 104303 / KCTC 5404 / NCIMB 10678 / 9a) TaxID=1128398 RepID=K0AVV9_GOTA9|nr:peptide ABC transporter substrate-binding protein [Gottschalkia acidurici]AFS78008.1 oligopeptide ABC transport system substrate binding protein AppA [Gottschalkia acidurici 9a]
MNFRKIISIIFTILLSLSLISCKDNKIVGKDGNKKEDQIDTTNKVVGGEMIVPITRTKALNPIIIGDSSMYYFDKLMFEGLFKLDKNLEPKELLAESYSINGDGSINISLRKDVKWHDGETLKSSDVKFTVDTIKYGLSNGKHAGTIPEIYKSGGISDINYIKDIYISDDYNMTIYFEGVGSNILEILTFPIIPEHAFRNGTTEDKVAYEKALDIKEYKPIGTGPYKQGKYDKLKSIELKVNDEYWGSKPYIKTIIGKVLKDEELALTSFESGQVDIAFSMGVDWEKYSQGEKVKVHEFPSQQYEFLAFNFKDKMFEGEKGLAIRKAIAYGINRDSIINKVYLGHATKTDVPINPNSWLVSKDAKNIYKYNVKKARDILEKAGWQDKDGDGLFEDEDNKKISIKLTTNSYNGLRTRALDMIAEDLKNIGIEAIKDYQQINESDINEELVEKDWTNFQKKIKTGKFEIALLGWETSFTQDISFMFRKGSPDNFMKYENPEMDESLDKIYYSLTKEEKRRITEKHKR